MTAHVVFILFSVSALLPFVKAFDYPPKEKRYSATDAFCVCCLEVCGFPFSTLASSSCDNICACLHICFMMIVEEFPFH